MNSSLASSSASSTPISPAIAPFVPYTTQRAFATASSFTPSLSQPSSVYPLPVSACDTATVLPSGTSTSTMSAFCLTQRDFFNTNSAYSDYCAVASPLQASQEITSTSSGQPDSPYCCSSPTLMSSITPVNAPSSSRVASPLATQGQADSEVPYHPLSLQASRSTSSLHLSKPFRYPKPNYNKSYKHLNRLKYHVPYGHCNFASPEDLEAPRVLLAQKGTINGDVNPGAQVTEEELHEIERRLRPYACGIDDCQRRYLGMKDLRTSLPHPGSHPHLLILSVCRTSLSALR